MLEWEATYGYGDIIGAITNAHWRNICYNDNKLKLVWYDDRSFYPPENKYHLKDPESVLYRTEEIISYFDPNKLINVSHEVKTLIGKRSRYVNRFKMNQWWTTLWQSNIQSSDQGYIAIWHPFDNIDDLSKTPGTSYKSPLNYEEWQKVIKSINNQFDVKYINYRMPVREAFNIVANSHACVGYEGIGQLISKNFWKPCITYTKQPKLSKITGGPWTMCDDKYKSKIDNLQPIIDDQLKKINMCKKIYADRQSRYRS